MRYQSLWKYHWWDIFDGKFWWPIFNGYFRGEIFSGKSPGGIFGEIFSVGVFLGKFSAEKVWGKSLMGYFLWESYGGKGLARNEKEKRMKNLQ